MKPLAAVSVFLLSYLLHAEAGAAAEPPLPAHLVCYDDVYEPYFIVRDGKITGLNVDILAQAGRRLGIEIEFRKMPWRRVELEVSQSASSGVDCAFAFSRTPERERQMTFGKVPLQATDYVLFVRDETNGVLKLDDLTGKVIGTRGGFRLPVAILAGVQSKRWRIEEVVSDEANFRKLSIKRIDALLTSRDVGLYTLREFNLAGIQPILPPVAHFDNYLVFGKSPNGQLLADAFDGALAAMLADNTVRRLREKYLGRDERK